MEVQLNFENDATVLVRVSGRVTQQDFTETQDPLEARYGPGIFSRKILLSLEDSDYMDSSGVGWLLRCNKRCRESGGRLVIYGTPPMVLNMLRMLRMDLVLHLAKDAAAARALLEEEKA
ncbi:MAG: STAS domain-containing protein [Pirellulales bacterium]|nr:STAS domain-containing protein [Pirellulales bacterium]